MTVLAEPSPRDRSLGVPADAAGPAASRPLVRRTDAAIAPGREHASVDWADWRVLLPVPDGRPFESLLLLGGSPALAEHLVGIGLARRVILEIPAERSAEAAVLLAGTPRLPADVAGSLRDDAVLYWEVDPDFERISGSSPRDALLRCGFSDVAMYEARPGFRACDVYISLDSPRVRRWNERRKHTPFWLRRVWTRLMRTARRPPARAVVAVRGESLRREAGRGVLAVLPPGCFGSASRLLVIKRMGRTVRDRRLIVLVFSSRGRTTQGVVKVARTPDHRRRIEREQSVLTAIRDRLDPEMARTLPQPLGCFDTETAFLGLETFVGGAPRAHTARERVRQFAVVASWIAEFHRQTTVERVNWGAEEIERWIEKPIASYREDGGVGAPENRFFEAVAAAGRRALGESLPLVWCHGDFNESNVFYSKRSLRVVDWETAHVGLPLFDLLYYAAGWSLRTGGALQPEEHLRLFCKSFLQSASEDEPLRCIRLGIESYGRAVGVSLPFLSMLIALHWIHRRSRAHVQCLARDGDFFWGRP